MTRDDIKQRMAAAGLKAPAQGDFIFIHWDQIAMLIEHERAAERERIFDRLKEMHEKTNGQHNYYLHAVMHIRSIGQRSAVTDKELDELLLSRSLRDAAHRALQNK